MQYMAELEPVEKECEVCKGGEEICQEKTNILIKVINLKTAQFFSCGI